MKIYVQEMRKKCCRRSPYTVGTAAANFSLFTFHLEVDADVQEEGVAVECEVVILGDIGQTELVASL